MWQVRVLLSSAILCFSSAYTQQLIINEVSQGTGSKEYVEFVVIGNPVSCAATAPTIDLRGVIIDDNNGYFASGSGTGIAPGALRFANISFWSAVPQGTYIVVYNEADSNPALPPDDTDLGDGNCRVVIPADSPLLEGTSASPNTGDPTYPASGWTAGGGSWTMVSMNNSNDSFQIPNLGVNGTPLHAVSWGNNGSGSIVFFAGSAGGKVFSFTNGTSNDWNLQANWSAGNVGADETPGAPNSPENDAWIATMNPSCGVSAGIQVTVQTTGVSCSGGCTGTAAAQVSGGIAPYTYSWSTGATTSFVQHLCAGTYTVTVTDAGGCSSQGQSTVTQNGTTISLNFSTTPESCSGTCDGTVSVAPSGGAQPYQYSWSNGATTASNPNVCPGIYSVTVTDLNGCTANASAVVAEGPTSGDATILTTGPFTTSDAAVQLQSLAAGGAWLTADCSGCLSAGGIFDPQVAGAGTFQVCHTVGSGVCMDNDCAVITVIQGCTPQATSESVGICPGDSVLVFGNWETVAGNYSMTIADISGCDSTHTVNLYLFASADEYDVMSLCIGDSIEIGGSWIATDGIYSQQEETANGCQFTHVYTVHFGYCAENDSLSLFVPNAFTPNGDQVNDLFVIELLGAQLDEGFIYNRWGNAVHRFDAGHLTWDGLAANGDLVSEGVYTYIFYYTPADGIRQVVHGFVTVIR